MLYCVEIGSLFASKEDGNILLLSSERWVVWDTNYNILRMSSTLVLYYSWPCIHFRMHSLV